MRTVTKAKKKREKQTLKMCKIPSKLIQNL